MKHLETYILKYGFVALLAGGVLSPLDSSGSCSLAGKQSSPSLSSSTIVTSMISHTWDYVDQTENANLVPIQNCDETGTLQVSKIAVNYNPENYQPQIYDSSKIQNMPPTCSLDSDLNKKMGASEHFDQYNKISSFVNACIGIQIASTSQIAITPMPSATCEFSFIDAQKTKVVGKGENCQIAKPKGGFVISPVYLDSCANTDIAKSGLANIEATLTVLETNKEANALATKGVQLVLNADGSTGLPVAKTSYRSPKVDMVRPSDYSVDIDFAQLSLNGSAKSGVTASAKYFVQNRSECKGDSCLSASSYRAPLVVENDLYLAKANNLGERIFLGRWYNASVVPAQWAGLDGSPVTNALVYNWNSIQLNSSFAQAEQGDSLVLVSRLVNPNRGIKAYITAGMQYSKNQHPVTLARASSSILSGRSSGSGLIGGVSTISAIPSIEFKSIIPELDFNSIVTNQQAANVDASKLWLVRYSRYCSQDNSENCADLGDISDLVNIETELKITKLDDSGVEIQPAATLKASSIVQNSYLSKLTKQTKIQCLKPEVSNNDIIRSKK